MLLICCLALRVVYVDSETPLTKTDFSFVSGCHLEIGLDGRWCSFPPLITGTLPGWFLCTPPQSPQSLWAELCQSSCVWRHCFFSVLCPFSFHSLSTSSSAGFPEPWGKGFDGGILFRIESSKVSQSLHTVQLDSYICCHLLQKESPLMMTEWDTGLWCSQMSLGVVLLLCSSRRTIVFCFLLGPWSLSSQVLRQLSSVRRGFPLI